ncbi:hypothetical protein CH259_02310 [Rhodococcus sp. 05-2254-4]|nr:hypothetical protein CH259_02310 [Rhodococcus sp. 05-2254-4]OZE49841.1 hypothetical protein CH261_05010 [Rhodococcus sp. 05-2254-3]OZE50479.1 hypothetical protein CH283_12315 [Rhodococcus sp. 05-2254-2]
MTAWIEVLTAMTSESNIPLRGTIEEVHEAGSPESFRHGFAYSGTPPVLIRPEDSCRVWRSGRRTRVERIDGSPIFISDGTRAWDFTGPADRPRVGPLGRVIYLGPSQFLLQQRSTAEWAGNEFAQPTGPVETDGRVRRAQVLDGSVGSAGGQAVSAPNLGRRRVRLHPG